MEETRLIIHKAETGTELPLGFADEGVRAGFPSPAQDYVQESIDLNRELVRHPATTFYARAVGDSMRGRGVGDGDLLVVDKSLEPWEGCLVVAYVDGEFTLKTLHRDEGGRCVWLMPANPAYEPIRVTEENEFVVWGVVTYNIKSQLGRRH
ncbi:MAG: translesion error-prone DNA polymerase V autoproteolytic subunit [Prevotellaceae bacterium]|nr:translesion error-prone DNA polymerase V autoproteolytic subunit [Prevotellaceae bacterium]